MSTNKIGIFSKVLGKLFKSNLRLGDPSGKPEKNLITDPMLT